MSALFTASTQNLRATLAAVPAYNSDYVLLTAWVKWDSGSTPAQSTAFELRAGSSPASGDSRMALVFASGMAAEWYGGWSGSASQSLGSATADTWRLIAMLLEPNAAGLQHARGYNNSSTPSSRVDTASAATTDLSMVTVGNRAFSPNSGTVWMGRVAECAIWTPADVTEASAIVAECLTTKPDAVTTATPIWYAPLEADASVVIGSALTNNGTVTFSDADHPSLSGGTPSATITLTPDPASVQVGGTRTFTATRSAPAGAGGVTYNVSSDNPAVATVPTPQALTEADSDLTFDATGVSVGTANITITNAADSSETDTVALTVTAVTTKKCKFLVHPDFASATGITIEVNEAPTGGALTGAKLGFATGIAAEATLEAGQAVIKVNAADVGASALAAGTSVRAIFKGLAASGSALGSGAEAGSVVVATGTIIEE